MDTETGEQYNRDNETGELLPYEDSWDNETGESENVNLSVPRRRTFRIQTHEQKKTNVYTVPITTRDLSPALLLLLPTLFIWPGIAIIAITALEVTIHMWAHRKNKKLTHSRIYYQSPMHIVASEFCALCLDQKASDKITRIQDKRAHRFKCHYEYVKRIVT